LRWRKEICLDAKPGCSSSGQLARTHAALDRLAGDSALPNASAAAPAIRAANVSPLRMVDDLYALYMNSPPTSRTTIGELPFNVYLRPWPALYRRAALPAVWRRFSRRTGLVDDPGHRKIHQTPIPLAAVSLSSPESWCPPVRRCGFESRFPLSLGPTIPQHGLKPDNRALELGRHHSCALAMVISLAGR